MKDSTFLFWLFHKLLEIKQEYVTEIVVTAQDMRGLVILPCHEMGKDAQYNLPFRFI